MRKSHISTITKNSKGDTHFGDLAHKVLYGQKRASYFQLSDNETIFVFLDNGQKDLQCWVGLESEKGLDIFLEGKKDTVKEEQLLIVRLS